VLLSTTIIRLGALLAFRSAARDCDRLAQFAGRRFAEAVSYLILDAPDERVREAGVIVGQAMLIAIGINRDGRCSGLRG
jgi:transposase-like protein